MDPGSARDGARAAIPTTAGRHLVLLLLVTLGLRLPLLDKPLQHDELYNAFPYLATSPLTHAPAKAPASGELPFDWAADWKRQLVVHPPTLSAFYFGWIRVFGDAPVSLHVPPLMAGCVGVGATYLLGAALAGPAVGLAAGLALTVSLSHIEHSTQAVHAAFEAAMLALSLWLLARLLASGRGADRNRLLAVNIAGVLLFYHYVVFLVVQTVILWGRRRRLAIGTTYFLAAGTAATGVAAVLAYGFARREYGYAYWMAGGLRTLGATAFSLPRYFIASTRLPAPASPLLDTFFLLLCGALLVAFLLALVRSVLAWRRERSTGNLLRLSLTAVFALPFLAYLAIALVGVARFGEPRNFFYLLPVYLVMIMDWLWSLPLPRRVVRAAAAAAIVVLLAGGINRSWPYWHEVKSRATVQNGKPPGAAAVKRAESFRSAIWSEAKRLLES